MVGLAAIKADEGLSPGASGVLFFLASYAFTNICAFIAIIAISTRTGPDQISDYAGIANGRQCSPSPSASRRSR